MEFYCPCCGEWKQLTEKPSIEPGVYFYVTCECGVKWRISFGYEEVKEGEL